MRKASTIDTKERSARRLRKAAWWLGLLVCVFPIAFRQVTVSDAWWHVALGKWMVEKRSLPDLSQFYFSPWDEGQLLSVLAVADCFALRLAEEIAGIANAARTAMIATTTNNSTSVNAWETDFAGRL